MRKPFTRLYCHLVWSTWDRLPLIHSSVEGRLYGAMRSKIEELHGTTLAIGGIEDHVHVLCSFEPALSISQLVQKIKGSSSHFMNHQVVPDNSFKWQGAYGAFSVSHRDLETVRTYVLNQKEHHRKAQLWPDWEQTWLHDEAESPVEPGE